MDIPGRENPDMDSQKKRVLVVDDEQLALDAISAMVAHLGYDNEAISDGFQALQLLENRRFDLVIVDMVMPQLGGLLLTKLIKQQQPQIPILGISGYYDKLSSTLKAAEFAGILPKPIKLKNLRAALKDIFSKGTSHSPGGGNTPLFNRASVSKKP
jgi:CheY-like chemotaxis protein